jgi:hypothetical protein
MSDDDLPPTAAELDEQDGQSSMWAEAMEELKQQDALKQWLASAKLEKYVPIMMELGYDDVHDIKKVRRCVIKPHRAPSPIGTNPCAFHLRSVHIFRCLMTHVPVQFNERSLERMTSALEQKGVPAGHIDKIIRLVEGEREAAVQSVHQANSVATPGNGGSNGSSSRQEATPSTAMPTSSLPQAAAFRPFATPPPDPMASPASGCQDDALKQTVLHFGAATAAAIGAAASVWVIDYSIHE